MEGDVDVVCLSQVLHKLSDPAVGSRDFLLADPMGDRARHWTGTRLSDFIQSVGDEMNRKVVKMLGDDALSMVVYEAYKLLEEDFTVIMQSTLRMKENARFVKRLRNVVRGAADLQGWSFSSSSLWIHENIPFGIFAQALVLLWDAPFTTKATQKKVDSLRAEGLQFFEDFMQKGVKSLQEEYEVLGTPSDEVMASLEFVKNPKNTEAAVREIVVCATLRKAQNASSHPFFPIASNAVRESALALYSSLLTHEFTEGIRNIAVLGKVKLDLVQFAEHAKVKQLGSAVDSWFSDSEDDGSDDVLSPKPSGLWES